MAIMAAEMETPMRTIAAALLGFALAACAGGPPPGPAERQAPGAALPPPAATTPAPQPEVVPTPPPAPPAQPRSGDIVVPAPPRPETSAPPPRDPRSVAERREDVRAWDRCVLAIQGRSETGTRPQLESPEEICAKQLGMAGRDAVPLKRQD
jgi:pyruvate/2-oxoglutarate dehydrogenase complex dihydrolipoamide acyltransferase (E2) component